MKDYLGNHVQEGDTVIVALRRGSRAVLATAVVLQTAIRPWHKGGISIPMVQTKYAAIDNFWMPADTVIRMGDEMPEKKKERLNGVNEAVQP